MSCEKCNAVQEIPGSTFYRWKEANIEFRGCEKHMGEIFKVLAKAQSRVLTKRKKGSMVDET